MYAPTMRWVVVSRRSRRAVRPQAPLSSPSLSSTSEWCESRNSNENLICIVLCSHPVRREKFSVARTRQTELKNCGDILMGVAMASPRVALSLRYNAFTWRKPSTDSDEVEEGEEKRKKGKQEGDKGRCINCHYTLLPLMLLLHRRHLCPSLVCKWRRNWCVLSCLTTIEESTSSVRRM